MSDPETDDVNWCPTCGHPRMEAQPQPREIGCIYCGLKMDLSADGTPGKMADHILSCDKSPLVQALKSLADRPKIICICGSSRFVDIAAVNAWEFEKQGIMVLSMHLLPQWYTGLKPDHQAEHENVSHILDELHLRKIDLADEVFVINQGGYIGDRTATEIAYAKQKGKPVFYMECGTCGGSGTTGVIAEDSGGCPEPCPSCRSEAPAQTV